MGNVIRNVRDIGPSDKQALEHLLGHSLREDQQLIIGVVNRDATTESGADTESQRVDGGSSLPEWCNVYSGLSDEEIADLEQTILTRADLSRPSG